jgi:hypothetical protein
VAQEIRILLVWFVMATVIRSLGNQARCLQHEAPTVPNHQKLARWSISTPAAGSSNLQQFSAREQRAPNIKLTEK